VKEDVIHRFQCGFTSTRSHTHSGQEAKPYSFRRVGVFPSFDFKKMAWSLCFPFFSPVEKDKDFSHQRRHYKEFRFDLTQIPDGEAVTASEFRIYKDRGYARYDNITLKVTIYQVIKEYPNKWVPASNCRLSCRLWYRWLGHTVSVFTKISLYWWCDMMHNVAVLVQMIICFVSMRSKCVVYVHSSVVWKSQNPYTLLKPKRSTKTCLTLHFLSHSQFQCDRCSPGFMLTWLVHFSNISPVNSKHAVTDIRCLNKSI